MKCSLLISTYNWPEALMLVLESVLHQTELPDEVVIADDGSGATTRDLVASYQKQFPIPLHHVWHEDEGFRAAKIRNLAITQCSWPYIIQIDGDTVLHKQFVADHKKLARPGCFISGSRTLVNPKSTKAAINERFIAFDKYSMGIKNRINATYFPLYNSLTRPARQPIEKLIYSIRGCNMSFWKEDLEAVNGYNEDFVGWGREDSELTLRLLRKGLALKRIKMAAIQFHLYHKERGRDKLGQNNQLIEKICAAGSYYAQNGMLKL